MNRGFFGLYILIFTVLMGVLGCSGEPDSRPDGIDSYRAVDRYSLETLSQNQVSGFGKILFEVPLQGVNSREHYLLEANLYDKDSELILYSHFNGFAQEDGLRVVFRRQNQDLTVSISLQRYPEEQVLQKKGHFQETDRIRWRVEAHNGQNNGVRLLLWEDFVSYQGERLNKLEKVTVANASYDSETAGKVFLESAQGVLWGLHLKAVRLEAAQWEAPYVD